MKTQADRRIVSVEGLVSVADIQAMLPIEPHLARRVASWTETIEKILIGEDPRLLMVVGPCSIHSMMSAIEFARHVHGAQKHFGDRLFIVMRAFFAKPRTRITGPEHWTGFINDPLLNGTFEMGQGARMARELLIAITSMGVPVGTEILRLSQANLLDDLISLAAIGARSSEFQDMRQMASGLCVPPSFKNGTGGSIEMAIDGILTAKSPQTFQGPNKHGVESKIKTTGNPFGHLVLRGSTAGPNFTADHIAVAKEHLRHAGIATGIGIDCSHGNSGKNPKNHGKVVEDVARQIRAGEDAIRMVMIESHLMGGRQDHWGVPADKLLPNLSITDPCENFGDTLRHMEMLADAIS